ncbi:MAG: hypothetical protein WD906_04245 [Anaerolineales bacterium]
MSLLPWTEGLWWIASLILLLWLHRRVHENAQAVLLLGTWNSRAAFLLYVIVLFPGVVFHELSHWLAATVLAVRVRSFSLRPRREMGGRVRLGYITTDRADPLRSALIGLAPTLVGSAALLIAYSASGLGAITSEALRTGDIASVLGKVSDLLLTPNAGIWIYLAVVVGNNMLPSPSDRSSWLGAGLLVGAVFAGIAFLGATEWVAIWALPPLRTVVRALAGSFSLVAILDLGLVVFLWLIRKVLEILTGRRVVERG